MSTNFPANFHELLPALVRDIGNETFTALCDSYLAELAIRVGDAAEAARTAESSLGVFRRQKLILRSAHSRLQSARAAYLSGDLTLAARKARAALAPVSRLFAPDITYKCRHLLGCVDRDRGRTGPALDNLRYVAGCDDPYEAAADDVGLRVL